MKTSNAGLDLIKKFEGLKLKAYRCPGGVWTIGYGSTKGVTPWMTISTVQAEQRLREDIKTAEKAVDQVYYLQKKLKQCQYDALVSFTFNAGISAFATSTLRKTILLDCEDPVIYDEFMKWCFVKGEKRAGLMNRRQEEAEWYFMKNSGA